MTRYMTTASISAALLDAHSSFIKLIPPKRKAALTTPIKAPPAIKPEASNVPFSKRAEFKLWSLLRLPTYQLIAPPIKSGVFRSKGINIPKANANAGILQKFNTTARTAPIAYKAQGAPEPLINGSITAAIAFACGAANCPVVKPYVWFNIKITPPTVAAETSVPKNFQVSCLAGVLPSQ